MVGVVSWPMMPDRVRTWRKICLDLSSDGVCGGGVWRVDWTMELEEGSQNGWVRWLPLVSKVIGATSDSGEYWEGPL